MEQGRDHIAHHKVDAEAGGLRVGGDRGRGGGENATFPRETTPRKFPTLDPVCPSGQPVPTFRQIGMGRRLKLG